MCPYDNLLIEFSQKVAGKVFDWKQQQREGSGLDAGQDLGSPPWSRSRPAEPPPRDAEESKRKHGKPSRQAGWSEGGTAVAAPALPALGVALSSRLRAVAVLVDVVPAQLRGTRVGIRVVVVAVTGAA